VAELKSSRLVSCDASVTSILLCEASYVAFLTLLPCLLAGAARGFSTFQSGGPIACRLPTKLSPPRREFHYATQIARRGAPRQRVIGTAGVVAMSALFFTTCLLRANAAPWIHGSDRYINANDASIMLPAPVFKVRGGDRVGHDEFYEPPLTPPIEFAHGTTTISFAFNGGIVAAVDSRASIGNFVGSKTVQKVLPVSR
jgi:hypothetical protein